MSRKSRTLSYLPKRAYKNYSSIHLEKEKMNQKGLKAKRKSAKFYISSLMCKFSLNTTLNMDPLFQPLFLFFFYQGFLSRTLTTHRTAEGRAPSFIPLYLFHPLTNNQAFICNFASEMTIT